MPPTMLAMPCASGSQHGLSPSQRRTGGCTGMRFSARSMAPPQRWAGEPRLVPEGGPGAAGRMRRGRGQATSSDVSSMDKDRLYDLLEVNRGAELPELKIAYRRLAKKYHPDVYRQDEGERFMMIQEAYNILSDPFMRKLYNSTDRLEEVVKEWEEKVAARKAAMEAETEMEKKAEERKQRMEEKMALGVNVLLFAWPLSYVAAAVVRISQVKAGVVPAQACVAFMLNSCAK